MSSQKDSWYTARWYNTEIQKSLSVVNLDKAKSLLEEQHKFITSQISEEAEVVVQPPKKEEPVKEREEKEKAGANLAWVPWAKIKKDGLVSSTKYPKGYPEGAVIHFTAGGFRSKDNATGILQYGKSMGYGYMALDTDGTLHQWQDLRTSDSHAGVSSWVINGEKVDGVSSRLVGIEICNPGRLELYQGNYYAWFDLTKDKAGKIISARNPIKPKECRISTQNNDNILAGAYLPFTKEQESELIRLMLWLKQNNPSVFSFNNVVGHDEVSGPKGIGYWRKNDPGRALSMTMTEFRNKLIGLYGTA